MTLREQMAVDACAFLNTEELGEKALWTRSGATSGLPRVVRLIEQPDRQTIRRANVWTVAKGTTVSQGDTFRVTRGTVTTTWRCLYTDPAETALQRSICQLRLTDTIKVKARKWMKRESGADVRQAPDYDTILGQWFQSSAEIDVNNRRRKLEGEWYLLVEELPSLATGTTLENSSGETFRIERLEQAFNRVDLPYLVCSRCDV